MTRTLDPATLHLDSGSHKSPESGMCLMEAVSMFAKEPFTDHPKCVSPYLRSFGIRLNDRASDHQRQDLVRFVPLVVGTAGDGLDEQRRWLAADHVTRISVPRWLDVAGLTEHASGLRALPTVTDRETWEPARSTIRAARDAAWELRRDRWATIRADARAAVEKALADNPVAVAAAVADAVADAVAAAVAVAVAVADAVAVAAAAAAAVAAAAAAAVAVADDRYWAIRDAVYKAVYAKCRATYGERFATVIAESWTDAVSLYERLINPAA